VCAPSPATGCRLAAPGAASVQIRNDATDTRDRFKWKWRRGDSTTTDDFKNPMSGAATYRVCVYDASVNPQPLMEADVPPGGTCGRRPCWKPTGFGVFVYRNRAGTPDGLTGITLKPGAAGRAKLQVKGRGVFLQPPSPPLALPVTVQLVIRDAASTECWQTTYTAAKGNDSARFRASGP
jgi:hypothetical protein